MVRLTNSKVIYLPLKTRMPFRYGIATMTDLPLAFLFLRYHFTGGKGTECWGVASDFLPPRWFKKDPDQPPSEEVEEMKQVLEQAVSLAESIEAPDVFSFCQELFHRQAEWGKRKNLPPLLVNFGTSLVERALIDASCRNERLPLNAWIASQSDSIDLGQIHPDLSGFAWSDALPKKPLESVTVRHTVGFGDPLTNADIPADEKVEDGLPQSLEAAIQTYGLRQFKIKIKAVPEEDLKRLTDLADLLESTLSGSYHLSLDGNEQFASWESFADFWEQASGQPRVQRLLERVLFIEQPLSRQIALEVQGVGRLSGNQRTPPVIIDESDADPHCFRQALECGYQGVSHKNCKGVFKGLAHRALIHQKSQASPRELLMSGEDLANIGPVALPQDLALQALLGNSSVERNGHHYFFGLSMFSPETQALALNHFPKLYRAMEQTTPTLNVQEGRLLLSEVNSHALGTPFAPEDLYQTLKPESL